MEVPELMDLVEEQLRQGVLAIFILQGLCGADTGSPSAGGTAGQLDSWTEREGHNNESSPLVESYQYLHARRTSGMRIK